MVRTIVRLVAVTCFLSSTWWACGTETPKSEPAAEKTVDAGNMDKTVVDKKDTTEVAPEPQPEPAKPEPRPEPQPEPTKPEPVADGGHESIFEAKPEGDGPDLVFTGLTYWKDTKAIFEQKCNRCHLAKGGVGPFPLTSYKFVNTYKQSIKTSVANGTMPPWQADKSCGTYTNDISLTPVEKAKILQWVDQGAKEGDPNDYVAPPAPGKLGLDRVDLTLKMKKSYTIKKKPDDYRCFVLDWPHTTNKFVTGFQVNPGNAKIVHHVIAYVAKKSEVAQYTKKDPNGDGYTCYGTAGGPAGLRWLGVWAPGVPGAGYYKDTGIKVEPGSKIIVQLHYNVLPTANESDLTSVDFRLEDSVKKEAILFPYTNPQWLRGQNMKIAANDSNATHSFNLPLSFLSLVAPKVKGLTIYSAMLHMHQLGASGRLSLGGNQCLLNIPKWDFNWQLIFHLSQPVKLGMSDSVGITCSWNNSAANQPIVDGKKRTPADVYWGDGTYDEMCLGIVYMTCSDAAGQNIDCPDLSSLSGGGGLP